MSLAIDKRRAQHPVQVSAGATYAEKGHSAVCELDERLLDEVLGVFAAAGQDHGMAKEGAGVRVVQLAERLAVTVGHSPQQLPVTAVVPGSGHSSVRKTVKGTEVVTAPSL